MSQLLRHSNGRLYWLGNLSEKNCCANNPRFPLVIAEVDQEHFGLIKATLLALDTLQEDDKEGLNLSHWLAYEDRESKEIRVPMRRWTADYKKFQGVEYVIGVGQRN
jgi:hypothetical protein